MTKQKTDIMIVEDEIIVAEGIEVTLLQLGYNVVAKAWSAKSALELASKHLPDLILMDIKLKDKEDGIYAAGQISSKLDTPVIFLTAYSDKVTLDRVKLTNPFGYVTKPFQKNDLRVAIELALYRHQQYKLLKETVGQGTPNPKSIDYPDIALGADEYWSNLESSGLRFTKREKEVCLLVRIGFSDQEIAERLCLSLHTVRDHLKHIHKKLKAPSRSKLITLLNGIR